MINIKNKNKMIDWSNPFKKIFVTRTAKVEIKEARDAYLEIKIIIIQNKINTKGKIKFIANKIPK